ncbi:MAG: toll/interleukin-1 receptor domain-containing protein [Thermoanaerobaculia bacterium]
MSFPFDVFLSYARQDHAFAVELARTLEDSSFRVWLDEEQILPGETVQDSLVRGLKEAQHAVFLVTDAWLGRDWTEWELESFLKNRSSLRRVIPVLRIPRDVERIGPYLLKLQPVEWPENDPEPEARLWELRCGLLGEAMGPRLERARRWRETLASQGPALAARTSAESVAYSLLALDRCASDEPLTCDRVAQWGQLTTQAARAVHETIFVVGPQGRGHELFLERIERRLPKDPPRTIHTVSWGAFTPSAKAVFFEALARALHCPPERLAATLRSQTTDQNLYLVHRPVCEKDFEDEAFTAYYTTWLPELIAEAAPVLRSGDHTGAVKLVQGIAWCTAAPVQSGLAWLARRVGVEGQWVEEALQKQGAVQAVARIRREAERRRQAGRPWLPAVTLDELPEITRQDVLEWSEFLPEGERRRFVDDAMLGARSSEQILERIVRWMKSEEA